MTLVIETCRSTKGLLETKASVEHRCVLENGIMSRLRCYGPLSRLNGKWEFSEVLLQEPAARATEKNVAEQHIRAIAVQSLSDVVQRACRWQMMPIETWPEEFRPQGDVADDGAGSDVVETPRQRG